MKNTLPEEQEFWRSLFDVEEVQRITEVGGIILSYQSLENKKYARACAFETKIDDFKCIAVNKILTNSQIFDEVWDSKKHDVMLSFGWRKGLWHIAMYSNKENIDVGAIAKKRGGGGHKGAAGFQAHELPFTLVTPITAGENRIR